ncbi:MAG TPA: pyridoxamine 5'-phosphate oxidase family protein [Acidimicrobiales bacterium]|nr:pyridoxamine 5'-phosphate oxidase family protein [Acidimicrobiales bacterium]
MWVDERGSQVLDRAECIRLLTLGASSTDTVGRVGFAIDGVPIILPVNYGMVDGDVVVRTGEGVKLLSALQRAVVAFEIDSIDHPHKVAWSVLVRGLCAEVVDEAEVARARAATPASLVAEPGDRYLRIRTGVLTGRRFPLREDDGEAALAHAPAPA